MGTCLTEEQEKILKEAHHGCKNKKSADRIKTILFLNKGFSYQQTAELLLLDDETIRRYERFYQSRGIDGLLECRYGGSHPQLTKMQENGLVMHLKHHTYLYVQDICAYVMQKYKVRYSISGMTQYVHRLGFVYKKTKLVPGKADIVKQAEFMAMYQQLKAEKKNQDRIYFIDATHPTHNTHASYGWIYKGTVKTVKANTGRERVNLNGAVCIEEIDVTVLTEETINSQALIRLLDTIQQKQDQGKLYVILDNARYNRSIVVQEYLKKNRRINPMYLPPYSPNLNVIERLWWYMHKQILYNRYYPTHSEFTHAIEHFFKHMSKHKIPLSSLLTDNFQTLPI